MEENTVVNKILPDLHLYYQSAVPNGEHNGFLGNGPSTKNQQPYFDDLKTASRKQIPRGRRIKAQNRVESNKNEALALYVCKKWVDRIWFPTPELT
uniref:Uncharacterized protein n=1 Tax=Arundo donax TaxID=35708 RepID=A0A0A9AY90_ARUDO